MSNVRTETVGQKFAGSPLQAVTLGRLYVYAGYGIIFATLFYAILTASKITAIMILSSCHLPSVPTEPSLLYGTGQSPVCDGGILGQAMVLAIPLLEVGLILSLIRLRPTPDGVEISAPVAQLIRRTIAPYYPAIERMKLLTWSRKSQIAPEALFLQNTVVARFERWASGPAMNSAGLQDPSALFWTFHEIGHPRLHDLLYTRHGDKAVYIGCSFVALFLAVAFPIGSLGGPYWLALASTGLECTAAFLFARYLFATILTSFEFFADNYASAEASRLVGRRLDYPFGRAAVPASPFQRGHPATSSRQTFVSGMNCPELLNVWLLALPMGAMAWIASTPRGPSVPAIDGLVAITDIWMSLCLSILGCLGGAAAAVFTRRSRVSWWLATALAIVIPLIVATGGIFDLVPFAADASGRLSGKFRPVLGFLALVSPLVGMLLRRRTRWFDVTADGDRTAGGPPSRLRPRTSSLHAPPESAESIWRIPKAVARRVHNGFVILAGISAAIFSMVLMLYVVHTGIYSWIHVVCFSAYFLVPLSHAFWPKKRLPLILDMLLQAFLFGAVVVMFAALYLAWEMTGSGLTPDGVAQSVDLTQGVDAIPALRVILDGTVWRVHRDEIVRDILGLYGLLGVLAVLRVAGQTLARQSQEDTDSDRSRLR